MTKNLTDRIKMASSQIPLPEKLDSKKSEEWKRWIEHFECYCIAAGLGERDEKVKINMLVYAVGGNGNEISRSFQLTEGDQVYETVKGQHTLWAAQTLSLKELNLTSVFKANKNL